MTCEDQTCFATTPRSRARGLLGTGKDQWIGRQLLLYPCRIVHTFGMRYPLDIAFIDRDARVIALAKSVDPFRFRSGPPSTCAVIERPAQGSVWYRVGDDIEQRGEKR